jgi:hypothetical protein
LRHTDTAHSELRQLKQPHNHEPLQLRDRSPVPALSRDSRRVLVFLAFRGPPCHDAVFLLEAAHVFLGHTVSGVSCSVPCTYTCDFLRAVPVVVDIVVEALVLDLRGLGGGAVVLRLSLIARGINVQLTAQRGACEGRPCILSFP